jgi:hypothetical protein
LGKV